MDDAALVAAVRAGDGQAERLFYDRHVERVYRLAFRIAGRADLAEDFTQETFIRAFERLGSFRGEAALSTWLHRIALSVSYNGLRARVRVDQSESLEELVRTDDVTELSTMIAPAGAEPDLKERLRAAIDALPAGCKAVFLMHDVEGFTHEEIGATLGVAAGTSKAQLFRAREKLRAMLAPFAPESVRRAARLSSPEPSGGTFA
ncbi:MAG: sigma-70 family RNA polymerase sigma factor [Gemmatimonadaceae bacterium]|nr:sigma-70 family RNA polymerase sigma factor [Gemmatimonadaceae bacterium]